MSLSPLFVVGAYYNHRPDPLLDPRHTRRRLFHEWVARLLDTACVKVTVVEHVIGERPYELDPEDPRLKHVRVLQLRGPATQEFWISWALLNYGLGHQPEEAKYVCWQDTDVMHLRPDWAELTVDMLQLHRLGQTWSHSTDLGPRGEPIPNERGHWVDRSFSQAWLDGDISGDVAGGYSSRVLGPRDRPRDDRCHAGYSVAFRRDVFNGIGRLIDWDITGSSDWHMMRAFTGTLMTYDSNMSPTFNRKLREFAARCDEYVRQDVGCVPGLLIAGYHGNKKDRHYVSRNKILKQSDYDPDIDIAYDLNGIPIMVSDNRVLRDGIRLYNRSRHEDAI